MSKVASAVVTVPNKLGLHARPATIFVETASSKKSQITVRRCDQDELVDGKSVLHMMLLAATEGTRIEITATGCDADEAEKDLVRLLPSCPLPFALAVLPLVVEMPQQAQFRSWLLDRLATLRRERSDG